MIRTVEAPTPLIISATHYFISNTQISGRLTSYHPFNCLSFTSQSPTTCMVQNYQRKHGQVHCNLSFLTLQVDPNRDVALLMHLQSVSSCRSAQKPRFLQNSKTRHDKCLANLDRSVVREYQFCSGGNRVLATYQAGETLYTAYVPHLLI